MYDYHNTFKNRNKMKKSRLLHNTVQYIYSIYYLLFVTIMNFIWLITQPSFAWKTNINFIRLSPQFNVDTFVLNGFRVGNVSLELYNVKMK